METGGKSAAGNLDNAGEQDRSYLAGVISRIAGPGPGGFRREQV